MKQNQNETSTQQPISDEYLTTVGALSRPNPPTEEAIKRAQFVDKTYKWNGR